MRVKKTILTVLVVLIITSGFYSCKKNEAGEFTVKRDVLSIGIEIAYPPMEYYAEDGVTPLGFDVELGKAIAEKLGLTPDFIDTSWDLIFPRLNANQYDCIISSVAITPARLAAYNFSHPYISNSLAMVVSKNSTAGITSPERLAERSVGFQAGTTADEFVHELGRTGLRFIPRMYNTFYQSLNDLQNGRVDAVITDLIVAYEAVASADSPFEIVWVNPDDEKFGICIRRGNDLLTSVINETLNFLWDDGTLLRISQETFGMDLVSSARN